MTAEDGDKTEEPTERRLKDASEKGNLPMAREVASAVMLASAVAVLLFAVAPLAAGMLRFLAVLLDQSADLRLAGPGDAERLMGTTLLRTGLLLGPVLAMLLAAALLAGFLQQPFRLVLTRVQPDLSRISPFSGLKRLLSAGGLAEVLRAMVKLGLIACVGFLTLWRARSELAAMVRHDAVAGLGDLKLSCLNMLGAMLATAVVAAGADTLWSRWRWLKSLQMSKQELKQEMKEADGDPLLKNRIRSLARSRARSRMMVNVPKATFVVVNPTHYAVAIKYVHGETTAPVTLAKGRDLVALRIRTIAEEAGIRIIEDRALARSLYDAVQVDKPIPPALYRPVAEIINYLQSRRARA